MKTDFLPEKIRTALDAAADEMTPIAAIRMNGAPDGESGECYVVVFETELRVFSRRLGENDSTEMRLAFADDILLLSLQKERFDDLLVLTLPDRVLTLNYPSYEQENIARIMALWEPVRPAPAASPGAVAESAEPGGDESAVSAPAASPVAVAESAEPGGDEHVVSGPESADSQDTRKMAAAPAPFELFLAALMYASAVDNDENRLERAYVRHAATGNAEALEAGKRFYSTHSTAEFLAAAAKSLNRQQRLCVAANCIELLMVDGVLASAEQQFIGELGAGLDISGNDLRAIYDILLLKNATSVLAGRAEPQSAEAS